MENNKKSMDVTMQKLLCVEKYEDVHHGRVRAYYDTDIKLLMQDAIYCLNKGYSRSSGEKKRQYWLKIFLNLASLYPCILSLDKKGIVSSTITNFFNNLAEKESRKKRIINQDQVVSQNKLPPELHIDQKKWDNFLQLYYGQIDFNNYYNTPVSKKISDGVYKVRDGFLVRGQFIPSYIFLEIRECIIKQEKTKIVPVKHQYGVKLENFEDIEKDFMEHVARKRNFSDSTKKEYHHALKLLKEFLNDRDISISDINVKVAEDFHEGLIKEEGVRARNKKRANNIVGFLSNVFNRLAHLGVVGDNFFKKEAIDRFGIKEKTTKRNFSMSELMLLFSGEHNIEKEILDYFRFKLHVGLRMEEFFRLNKNSFITETIDGQAYNCVIIDTAKGKCSSESKRVIVLHENIKDLHNYKWVKAIKEQYPTIKSFNKKANGCIRKVISDKKVSDHRLRGNFAKKLVEYDHINNISDSIVNVADELGHNTNKNNRKNLEEYNDLVRGMMGYNLSDALDIYAQSKLLKTKLRDIKAFDEYSGIFKYLDIPSNKIPHIKSNKNNKNNKKDKK